MRGQDSPPITPARRCILIVDDHVLVRRGLTALIDNEPDLIVCAELAFRAGASGYVGKQEMSETLLVAIRSVLGGVRYLSPKIGAALAP
jgi:DNA-binding NarL/FixJ family response regulator